MADYMRNPLQWVLALLCPPVFVALHGARWMLLLFVPYYLAMVVTLSMAPSLYVCLGALRFALPLYAFTWVYTRDPVKDIRADIAREMAAEAKRGEGVGGPEG
jgi:hypothetical protein